MIFKSLINYLMPHRCVACSEFTEQELSLCAKCWKEFVFIEQPWCKICGLPFEIEIDNLCLSCLNKKPPFSKSRSLFKFNEQSRILIHGFKYHDRTYLAKFFSKLFLLKYKTLIEEADLITCVPMHKLKRIIRMYNQSHLLGKELSLITGKTFIPDILCKTKYTKSQTFFSKTARKKNLKDSINCPDVEKVIGKKIILIDDVITTGETIKLCSRVLKKAGAADIYILSVAKNYR